MDKAVKWDFLDERQALKRDREPMDKAVKWDFRDERQATGRDRGATDQNQKRGFGETECPLAPHIGGAEVHIHEPLPKGKTRCLPSSHAPQEADVGGVASGLSGCMIQADLQKASFERASHDDRVPVANTHLHSQGLPHPLLPNVRQMKRGCIARSGAMQPLSQYVVKACQQPLTTGRQAIKPCPTSPW